MGARRIRMKKWMLRKMKKMERIRNRIIVSGFTRIRLLGMRVFKPGLDEASLGAE